MKRKARRPPANRESSPTPPHEDPSGKTHRITRASTRRLESRERVIAVARDLFLERGFDETPVREIVARSGISMRTFFRYFPSKEDLAFPRAEEGTRRLRELLERHRNPERPLMGVRDALVALSHWYDEMRDEFLKEWRYESRSTVLIARGAEIEARNQGVIAEALERAGVDSLHARYLASVIFGGIRANLEQWFDEECRRDLREVSGNTMMLLEVLETLPFVERCLRATEDREGAPATVPALGRESGRERQDQFLGRR